MPVIVITNNTVPQNTPFGSPEAVYTAFEDAHMHEEQPDTPVGVFERAISGLTDNVYTPVFRAIDVRRLPRGAANIQARLYVNFSGGGPDMTVDARPMGRYWLPGGLTYNDYIVDLPWASPGATDVADRGAVLDTVVVSTGWSNWDVSAAISDWLSVRNYGVGLYARTETFRFVAGTILGSDGQRPELHLSYDAPAEGAFLVPVLTDVLPPLLNNVLPQGGAAPVRVNEKAVWVSGNSLFKHDITPATPFTNTGFAMGDLSRHDQNQLSVKLRFSTTELPDQTQQQVFLTNQFDAWPDFPGYPTVAFSEVGWTETVFMARNFIQTFLSGAQEAAEQDDLLDFLRTNAPSSNTIIYQHWAEPAQYGYTVFNTNELSPADWDAYKEEHRIGGQYYLWHADYYDAITSGGYSVYMVPVGPIIFDALQTEAYLTPLAFSDLFVDGAPHGNDNIYFLAGVVMYVALFGGVSAEFTPLNSVNLNSAITNNFDSFVLFTQQRLAFYAANGVNVPPAA